MKRQAIRRPGQPFGDMIASGAISLNRLTGKFRQSSFSEIVKAARAVIKGEMPELHESLDTVDFAFIEAEPENVADVILGQLFEKMPKTMLGATYEDIQLLSPMHSHSAGISNLNQLVQRRVSKKGQPIYSRKSKDGELGISENACFLIRIELKLAGQNLETPNRVPVPAVL